MKRLKLNLDQLGQELEMLDLEHLHSIKGGTGSYGGYNSWEELWAAMQNGYVPPEGEYNPGGYGDYGWGDYGNYGGYNGGWPHWYGGGYGDYGTGGYGGYGGVFPGTPHDCFILCFKEVHNQKFGGTTYFGPNNSYIFDTVQDHAVGVGGMPYPINEYGVPYEAAYSSLSSSFENVSRISSINDLTSSLVSESSVILGLNWNGTNDGHAVILKSVYVEYGVKKYEIYDPQNPDNSGHYYEDFFSSTFNFVEAYVIGNQDNFDQFTHNLGFN
ncbi:hypothetical protein [Sphingobacterium olei]|uniref:hypothetical protein n=1 Tax=Sphingobacterium olei TaxID=2571155 RepID=UPI00192E38E3|nr:hypothetical protein [Sphingobacterium olei]